MCQKIPYDSKAEAIEHSVYIATQRKHYSKKFNKSPKSGRKLRPYHCPLCGLWHLTTRKK